MCDIRTPAAIRRQIDQLAREQRRGVANVLRVSGYWGEDEASAMTRCDTGARASEALAVYRATADRLGVAWCDGVPNRDECETLEWGVICARRAMLQGTTEGEYRCYTKAGELAISWPSATDVWVSVAGGRVPLPANLSEAVDAVTLLIRWGAY